MCYSRYRSYCWFEQARKRGECSSLPVVVQLLIHYFEKCSCSALHTLGLHWFASRAWRTFKLFLLCIGLIFWIVSSSCIYYLFLPFSLYLITSFLSFRVSSKFFSYVTICLLALLEICFFKVCFDIFWGFRWEREVMHSPSTVFTCKSFICKVHQKVFELFKLWEMHISILNLSFIVTWLSLHAMCPFRAKTILYSSLYFHFFEKSWIYGTIRLNLVLLMKSKFTQNMK